MSEEYVPVGPKPYLDRLVREYRLRQADLRRRIRSRSNPSQIGDERFEREYLVHRSVLRSQGAFRCAGDAEAEAFCNEVAHAMVTARGVTREEAVARINRQWSSTWIVGLDLVYHRTAERWAEHIYRHT
jgi:hypothetical protein